MSAPQQLFDEAFAAYGQGERDRARDLLGRYFAGGGAASRAYLLKGVMNREGERVVSLAMVEQAAYLDPADPQAWYNLGVVRAELGQLDLALEAYQRALRLDPTHLDALGNGAELMRRRERFEEALAWADRVVDLGADSWQAQLNRAISLLHLRRFADAEAAFVRARAYNAEDPMIAWEQFSLMLFQRRFAEAWDAFEHRFACGDKNGVFAYPFIQPLWTGQSLVGKSILVHHEQGLGDQLMFAHALNEVIATASAVTLVVAPTLVCLFAASFPTTRVLAARYGAFSGDHPPPDWLESLGPIDYQAPIGSLMAVLRRTPERFADPKPYLHPSAAARESWSTYDPGSGLKVGLCWASNPALFRADSARRATRKSMMLETMAPLARIDGVAFVSVLNWKTDAKRGGFGRKLADVSERLLSLDDTAALIERLDIVITVDTAVAHLAGALGKETWLLLHDFADCRWELEADASYWYPNMRLIRQTEPGAWGPVIAAVAADLTHRVEALPA